MAAAAAAEKDAALEVLVLVEGTRPPHLLRIRPWSSLLPLRHDDADMVGKRCVCVVYAECGLCGVWVE